MERRKSSLHYQTFPSLHPPRGKGKPPRKLSADNDSNSGTASATHSWRSRTASVSSEDDSSASSVASISDGDEEPTPLPKRQLLILAIISLAEQMAYNSIAPYLPEMVGSFSDVQPEEIGLKVGLIASSFAAAQFVTNFLWGHLSDRIGRKPVILSGTLFTAISFAIFGLCRTFWQAVVVQAVMGAVNGNQGVVSTILGEITDRSNQSAFAYLPVVYGIGAIVGPLLGGVLVNMPGLKQESILAKWPYLLPNLVVSAFLILDWLIVFSFLEESLEGAEDMHPLKAKIRNLFASLWQFRSPSHRLSYLRRWFPSSNGNQFADGAQGRRLTFESRRSPLLPGQNGHEPSEHNDHNAEGYGGNFPGTSSPQSEREADHGRKRSHLFRRFSNRRWRKIFTPSITFLLATFTVFNFGIVAYNSLYPIFVSAPLPTGRNMKPKEIGLSLALGGLISILFQAFCFNWVQERLGNIRGFRVALLTFGIAFFLMPFVSDTQKSGKVIVWAQLAAILSLKVVASVMALTCAMLLITNCAPTSSTLGTLNGVAQSLSSLGRSFGPLLSGSIFTLATRTKHGDMLVWFIFGGIGLCAAVLSLGIGKDVEEGGVGRRREEDEV